MINQKPMCRRRFLGLSAGFASSALIPGIMKPPNLNADDSALSFPVANGYKTHVTSAWIGKGEHVNSSDLIERTLSAATDFKWLSKGDRVLIKLSINSGNVFPATSDPWMLNGLISILQKKGAGVIFVGDQSGVADVHWTTDSKKGSSRELCKSAELMRPIADNNAKPVFFEEAGYDGYFETRPENAHHWKTPIWLPNILKEVDHIIYAPRISSHIMGDITVGMKLGVGFLREDSRRDFHSGGSDFYAMYEEVNQVPEIKSKLRLIATSGRVVLSSFGPDDGYISEPDYGLITASEDLLASELLSYAWLEWNRQHETSSLYKMTMGNLTNFRSFMNRMFVKSTWGDDHAPEIGNIELFRPGNIFHHPSILNYMKRMGGRPETIDWETVNGNKDPKATTGLMKALLI